MHQIGVGVLGPVYRTYEPAEDRLVAVKAFHLDITPEQSQTLVEALASLVKADLSHPAVTPLAVGLEGDIPYLAQEYVAAESLDVAMRHYAPAAVERAMPVITQIAEALDAAHERGVVHGALHLRDIFVSPDEVRVTGFGIVRALEELDLAGPIRRPYTAPEIIAGRPWGAAADRFALAAIAYELLTGRRAAGSGDQVTARLKDVAGVADPEHLQDIFAPALADDSEDRFATASAFVSALAGAIGDGVSAHVQTGTHETANAPLDLLAGLEIRPFESREDVEDEPFPDPPASEPLSVREPDLVVEPVGLVEPDDEHRGEPDVNDVAAEPREPEPDATEPRGQDDPSELDAVSEDDERPSQSVRSALMGFEDEWEADESEEAKLEASRYAAVTSSVSGGPSRFTGVAALVTLALVVGAAAYFIGFGFGSGDQLGDVEFIEDVVDSVDPPPVVPSVADSTPTIDETRRVPDPPATTLRSVESEPPAPATPRVAPPPVAARQAGTGSEPDVEPEPVTIPPRANVVEEPATGPAVSSGFGWLLVRTEPPGAAVTLDGERRGETPLSLRDVPFGRHVVEVSHPGFAASPREVILSAEDDIVPVSFEMRPESAARQDAGGVATTSLAVESRPAGARVFIDREVVGVTPLVLSVPPGTHRVRIERDGYRPWVTTVEVTTAEPARVAASLERGPR